MDLDNSEFIIHNSELHVWLIGGTSDSAEIARLLSDRAIPYVVTVTTTDARKLYPEGAQVWVGKLSLQIASDFLRQYRVGCISDASHPFASEISEFAIALSQKHHIPYLRYERPQIEAAVEEDKNIIFVDSIDALVDSPLLQYQRVLFTIGYRYLSKFAGLRATSKLYARILPSEGAIAGTLSAGFSPKEIVALRPPISFALEQALWQQWKISCVVAKASGHLLSPASSSSGQTGLTQTEPNGGEQIKRQVAKQLGVRLILIRRPPSVYPRKTERIADIAEFCLDALSLYSRKSSKTA